MRLYDGPAASAHHECEGTRVTGHNVSYYPLYFYASGPSGQEVTVHHREWRLATISAGVSPLLEIVIRYCPFCGLHLKVEDNPPAGDLKPAP